MILNPDGTETRCQHSRDCGKLPPEPPATTGRASSRHWAISDIRNGPSIWSAPASDPKRRNQLVPRCKRHSDGKQERIGHGGADEIEHHKTAHLQLGRTRSGQFGKCRQEQHSNRCRQPEQVKPDHAEQIVMAVSPAAAMVLTPTCPTPFSGPPSPCPPSSAAAWMSTSPSLSG